MAPRRSPGTCRTALCPPTNSAEEPNFLWGAPRIHGELLKLGIKVSQATISRYMPTSRKDGGSQAWRTFIRNHAIAIVQSRSFNGHNWARDLLSQIRSRSRIFAYHLSATVVAPITGPSCWAGWRTFYPLLVAVARPRVWSTKVVIPTTKSTVLACRYSPATRKIDPLTIDRIRDPPTPHELRRHAVPLIDALDWQTRLFMRPTWRHGTASSANRLYSQTAIGASNCDPRPASSSQFGTTLSRPRCLAAHVLRNDKGRHDRTVLRGARERLRTRGRPEWRYAKDARNVVVGWFG
jgi:hypothetical protein